MRRPALACLATIGIADYVIHRRSPSWLQVGALDEPAHLATAILLVIWPISLYQLTDNMAGVAIGLVVASAVLLVAVLILSRRHANR